MKYDTDIFIQKAIVKHNNKYNYDKVIYKGSKEYITIHCELHGDFIQWPSNHLHGQGCPKCYDIRRSSKCIKTQNEFINDCILAHGNYYDYTKSIYISGNKEVTIICPKHGEFNQKPSNHLSGRGCKECGKYSFLDQYLSKNRKIFLEESIAIHNNYYDYSLVEYINCKIKVCIICPKHGEFNQKPDHHVTGRGCPKCKESKGEKFIESYLISNKFVYERQKKFINCRNVLQLSFDFYVPKLNLLIEFDGVQHFRKMGYSSGDEKIKYTKLCDSIKDRYCIDNKISLLRISYKDINNIDNILNSNLHRI